MDRSEVTDSGGKYLGGRGRSLWTDSRRASGSGVGTTVTGGCRSMNCADAALAYFRRARKRSIRMANTKMMIKASPPITAPTITPMSELDFPLDSPPDLSPPGFMCRRRKNVSRSVMTYFSKESTEGRKNNQMAVTSKRMFKRLTVAKLGL